MRPANHGIYYVHFLVIVSQSNCEFELKVEASPDSGNTPHIVIENCSQKLDKEVEVEQSGS